MDNKQYFIVMKKGDFMRKAELSPASKIPTMRTNLKPIPRKKRPDGKCCEEARRDWKIHWARESYPRRGTTVKNFNKKFNTELNINNKEQCVKFYDYIMAVRTNRQSSTYKPVGNYSCEELREFLIGLQTPAPAYGGDDADYILEKWDKCEGK